MKKKTLTLQNEELLNQLSELTEEKDWLEEGNQNLQERIKSLTYAFIFFGLALLLLGIVIWHHF